MKSASRLNNALLVIVSIIVSFLIAEAMLRLFSSGDYFVWQPNLRQIFRPSPGVMPGISGDSRFFINESGIRGRSFSRKDGYRILALGGSTTECLYLDQSETWSHLLQEILNEEFEALPVWVGNVGKSGHSTSQHILQTEKLLDQYPTIDLVVLLIGVNDLLRRLILDEKYRPLSEEGLGYQERLRRAFAVYPSWDESSSFYERTEIRRTWRRIRQHFLKPTVEVPIAEVPIQDKFGDFFTKLRNHRKDARAP